MTGKELLELLQERAKGLLYMSEADFSLKPFVWEKAKVGADSLSSQTLAAFRKIEEGKQIEEVPFANFFASATTEQDWFGPEEKESAEGFRKLVEALQANLTDLKVFKVGDAKKDVYVVGKTSEGDFAGVTTKVVET
jgi:hypothetical protein